MQRRFSRWLVNRKVLDVPAVSKALLECRPERVRIGELVLRHEYLDESQIDRILQDQAESGERFGAVAIRLGLLTEEQLAYLLALQKEDPHDLRNGLVRLGLLEQKFADAMLREFIVENTSKNGRDRLHFSIQPIHSGVQ